MTADKPIPRDLRRAFERSVLALAEWRYGGSEPLIAHRGRRLSIAAITELAGTLEDTMPPGTHAALIVLAGIGHEPANPSFRAGACCLKRLYAILRERHLAVPKPPAAGCSILH